MDVSELVKAEGRRVGRIAERVSQEMVDELLRASAKFPSMNSAHEGYAVLLEEVDELWEEVKKNDSTNMRAEAIQVGAMAMRFVIDVLSRDLDE